MNLDGVTATASLDGFDLDGLLGEAQEVDGVETPNVPAEAEAKPVLEECEVGVIAALIVTTYEGAIKMFGDSRYTMPSDQKEWLTKSYGAITQKHESKLPESLKEYKEEVVLLIVTVVVLFMGYMTVRELRRQDAERIIEAQGGDDAS